MYWQVTHECRYDIIMSTYINLDQSVLCYYYANLKPNYYRKF